MRDLPHKDFAVTSEENGNPEVDGLAHLVRVSAWCTAVLVAAFSTWSARFSLNPDGLSYLDIADNYLHRDWPAAINAYWSPLYSWMLAVGLGILHPNPYWKFPAIQLVNFVISLLALAAFDVFWRAQGDRYQEAMPQPRESQTAAFPRWAWLAIGYALFIWTLTNATLASSVTPDLLLAAILYVAAALLVRMRARPSNVTAFFFFGLVLGLGYLGKTAMFVLAFVFLAVSFFTVRSRRKGILRLSAAFLAFLIVIAPFVLLISRQKGRFTFGDSGRLGYAWVVNRGGPFFNWQGPSPAGDLALHPTRKLFSNPVFYEFGAPIPGTYPPHYDPSYWNDGLKPHFRFWQQIRVLLTSAYASYDLLFLPLSGLFVGILITIFLSDSLRGLAVRLAEGWHLGVPALAGLCLYALVTVEPRYVAAFVTMLLAVVLSAVRVPHSAQSKKLLSAIAIAAVLTLSLSVTEKLAVRMYEWKQRSTHGNWEVAEGLRRLGIHEGDKIVSLGSAYNAYWAHLAGLKIIGEIPSSDVVSFWGSGPETQAELFSTCNRIGARAIVTAGIPVRTSQSAWLEVGKTGFYVYLLSPPGYPVPRSPVSSRQVPE